MGRWSRALALLVVLLLGAVAVLQTGVWVQALSPGEYETTAVEAVDANGTHLATVDARVADTTTKRTVGLSQTDALARDEGMVFVFDERGDHGFVMRGMDFPLDIVFADADGTVTTVRHASAPDGPQLALQRETYTGEGQYVLEVNRGWTNRTGLDEGDRLAIPGETTDGAGAGSDTPGDGGAAERCSGPNGTVEDGAATTTPTDDGPTVTAANPNGTALGTVAVDIADNGSERYTGLSDTESLAWDEGMLFVYPDEDERAFVMRRMDFPLDMVFVAANGTVTTVHHAPVPPEGTEGADLERYRGQAQYVLEVNRGWTNETGLDVGDCVRVPANATATA